MTPEQHVADARQRTAEPAWKPDADTLGDAIDAFVRKHLEGNRMAAVDLLLLVHQAERYGWKRLYDIVMRQQDRLAREALERRAISKEV